MKKTAEVASSPQPEAPPEDKPETPPAEDKVSVVIRMAPGDVVRIFVKVGDGRELGRVVQAGHDGSLRIMAAPDPPAPSAGG